MPSPLCGRTCEHCINGSSSTVIVLNADDFSAVASRTSDNLSFGGGGLIRSSVEDAAIYAVGLHGWIELDPDGAIGKIINFDGMHGFRPAISDDGSVIFGQKADTVTEDTAYALDSDTGEVLASLTFGDAGGAMHAGTTSDGPYVILFIGTGAREPEQRGLVLDPETMQTIQTINGRALDEAISAGADQILIARSAGASTGSGGTGLSAVRQRYDPQRGWQLDGELDLIVGPGVFTGSIASNDAKTKFYLTSPSTGHLFVVSLN